MGFHDSWKNRAGRGVFPRSVKLDLVPFPLEALTKRDKETGQGNENQDPSSLTRARWESLIRSRTEVLGERVG